jgi:hypothetical protein
MAGIDGESPRDTAARPSGPGAVRFAGIPEGLCIDAKKPCKLSWRLSSHRMGTGDRSTYTAIWKQPNTQFSYRVGLIYGGVVKLCKEKDGESVTGDRWWKIVCSYDKARSLRSRRGVMGGGGVVWKWIKTTRKKTTEPNKALQTTFDNGCAECHDGRSASEL